MGEIKGISARTAAWSTRHRALAVVGWLVFVVAVTILSGLVGTVDDDTGGAHGESARAERLISDAGFPDRDGEMVLVRAGGRTVDDPQFAATLTDLLAALDRTGVALDRATRCRRRTGRRRWSRSRSPTRTTSTRRWPPSPACSRRTRASRWRRRATPAATSSSATSWTAASTGWAWRPWR